MPAVIQYAQAIEFAAKTLLSDVEIVTTAVRKYGLALGFFASGSLRNNKQIVYQAVNQDGLAIQYASDPLKKNREVA